ncbi:hypothetical protein PPACK8108_LOCUS3478 [Phakopsora pachyrhizi]|uniref:Uncharacterized protein n=1 Tax=Phakopsora pachyrhizi TaxID=170000 RepID=A0AAV0AK18_PHAPC|nr:hypothetical protein PPACK8108_LOCUS3478 [Phakopsora pachyrhizi]
MVKEPLKDYVLDLSQRFGDFLINLVTEDYVCAGCTTSEQKGRKLTDHLFLTSTSSPFGPINSQYSPSSSSDQSSECGPVDSAYEKLFHATMAQIHSARASMRRISPLSDTYLELYPTRTLTLTLTLASHFICSDDLDSSLACSVLVNNIGVASGCPERLGADPLSSSSNTGAPTTTTTGFVRLFFC